MSTCEYRILEQEYEGINEGFRIASEKLEAIRNQMDEFPCVQVQDYQRMMRKIKKILEAEASES